MKNKKDILNDIKISNEKIIDTKLNLYDRYCESIINTDPETRKYSSLNSCIEIDSNLLYTYKNLYKLTLEINELYKYLYKLEESISNNLDLLKEINTLIYEKKL